MEVRYWFTEEVTAAQQTFVDWAGRQPSGTTLTPFVSAAIIPTTQGGQTHYLRWTFNAGVGVLNPGEDVEVQGRFNKVDFSDYTQSNDYSYAHETIFGDTTKLTAYLNGVLAAGIEP